MRTASILGTLAVAGIAFTAGLCWTAEPTVSAAPQEAGDMPPEMKEMMEAYAKAGTPGKHHRNLDHLLGEWHGEFRMWMEPDSEPMVSTGTVTREWVLDGHFVKEEVEASSDMGAFSAIGYLGYNNLDGRYEFVWMESMYTGMTFGTGSYDSDARTFRWIGEHKDPRTGHLITSWSSLEITSPDNHIYTGWQVGADGKKFKSFEGKVARK